VDPDAVNEAGDSHRQADIAIEFLIVVWLRDRTG